MKNKENIEFVTDENKLIQEKFLFMRDMYQDSIYDKRTNKKQIMGSRDSFGKIFDITSVSIRQLFRSWKMEMCG